MTQTLGSKSNASLILAHVKEHSFVAQWSLYTPTLWSHKQRREAYDISEVIANLPDGWQYLGSGWSRDAFLGPDGVVYKVARGVDRSAQKTRALQCSYAEARCYREKAEKVAALGWRLAASRLLNNSVIAMEYVKPHPTDQFIDWEDMLMIERELGFGDLHSGNCWKDINGIKTIIDYAA